MQSKGLARVMKTSVEVNKLEVASQLVTRGYQDGMCVLKGKEPVKKSEGLFFPRYTSFKLKPLFGGM